MVERIETEKREKERESLEKEGVWRGREIEGEKVAFVLSFSPTFFWPSFVFYSRVFRMTPRRGWEIEREIRVQRDMRV